MRVFRIVISAAMAVILPGCASLGNSFYDPYTMGDRLNGPQLAWDAAWQSRFSDADLSNVQQRFAYELIRQSDRKCENYLVGSSVARNSVSLSFDILGSLFGTAATLASPSASANIFAAGSTLSQSTNRSVTNTLFASQEFSTLYTAVHRGRDAERTRLFNSIRAGDFDGLSPEAIAAALEVYDRKCGVNYGMSVLSAALEQHTPSTDGNPLEGASGADDQQ